MTAILFTSMLKTMKLSGLVSKTFVAKDEIIKSGGRVDKIFKNLTISKTSKNNKPKNLTHMQKFGAIKESTFLTLGAREIFNLLRQTFIKAPIFPHFN